MTRHKLKIFSTGYLADIALAVLSFWLALYLAYGTGMEPASVKGTLVALVAYGTSMAVALVAFRLNQLVWRWTSADDLVRLSQAIAAAGISTIAVLFFVDPSVTVPRISPALAAVVTLVLMAAARGLARVMSGGGLRALFRTIAPNAPATILVGPTDAITQAIHTARLNGPLPIRPIAIVSTLGTQVGKIFAGARVFGGLEALEPLVIDALSRNSELRIALIGRDPGRKAAQVALQVSARRGVALMRIPEGAGATLGAVHPADVLGRTRRELDLRGPRGLVRFKKVLVTGAGGTIGSEIVKQIAELSPSCIVLVDSSENNLFQISSEIRATYPSIDLVVRLCDIRDEPRIRAIFEKYRPHVVVHAAANKHVPMMEDHFCEALEVNLGGTCVVADAAMAVDVESFVFISTDKAVNPVNVMGAAKRVAELYVRDCSRRAKGAFHSVRFGNVLGSSGSVMPVFERQIARGGPVTITHSEMTRWFMTVEEASSLVLQAAAIGAEKRGAISGGQFVLDMGEPVRIMELAEAMIRMKGKEPWRDIAIIETGLRPGERLHEELFHNFERVENTSVEGVLVASDPIEPPDNLRILIDHILEAARKDKETAALTWLQRVLPDFKPRGDAAGLKAVDIRKLD
ncbi:UDP-N-acetyl-alpha-D-glucosamine C6 dehydratase [Candidatus Phycosocius bacilliformis]|uniref:UDP-N-acetyl-alpha-D-glucosamine C6 dehydratase n=1 Tax=Candidatus Phycosocius bacilliformis TaxID=1445552 RepID=A0A2P2E6J7_9PROT|nr:nucleoside-diphosphate sugar epimerase/dehydratase [Candidatus Phycosocius bacilliformis]GBF56677.1 UDP-N-acetyl-alpha-D-glucosamine C6 dehydratase [Candidatus Phycosocius bacilliformis]